MYSLKKAFAFAVGLNDESGLRSYLRQIRDYPLLEASEEQRLARCWRNDHDLNAAHTLVTSHLRLSAKIAMGYRGYQLPPDELISEANIGLMQAVERFDPERGFRLATYAMWWIRDSIQEYILQSWSLVRLGTTAQQKKLFFNLRKIKGQIQAYEEGDLSPEAVEQIAGQLNVSAADVVMMNRRLSGHDKSLNTPLKDESDSEWQEWLIDEGDDQEVRLAQIEDYGRRRALLARAIAALAARERDILTERRLRENPITLEQLARKHGVSRERVRQIEVGVIAKLKRVMQRAAQDEEHKISENRERYTARSPHRLFIEPVEDDARERA
jgi:RNA polymerase sigma-32 factor